MTVSLLPERVEMVDGDFLEFELERISKDDRALLQNLAEREITGLPNPRNSIVMWCLGLTDQFDHTKARSDMIGGAPPDVDMDFDSLDRQKAMDRVAEDWGRDNVANIAAYGTFKPKSITAKYLTAINKPELIADIRKRIPAAKYGAEASWAEIIKQEKEKKAGPSIDQRYPEFYQDALKLEDMVIIQSIHAAGLVVSNDPIRNHLPTMTNKKAERITQFDKVEVEELGLLKFDFLAIENLSILKECCRLIRQNHQVEIDIWNLPDNDLPTYQAMWDGHLTGVFQFETSSSIKELTKLSRPQSIDELADISSLNRPGPMEAGFHTQYVNNTGRQEAPKGMPESLAAILKKTRYVVIYQETIMKICNELAGFTLQEADDVRKALGKKDAKKLEKSRVHFIEATVAGGWPQQYAEHFWQDLVGFASYCFNASHAVSYSYVTYACAYLKRHYSIEFFSALLTVRAQTLQPKKWAVKAPEYVNEARHFGIEIIAPTLNFSESEAIGRDNKIYFGLRGIRNVGDTAVQSILAARGSTPFASVIDFLFRVNRQKVNTKVFQALVKAGCLDKMGYSRQQLIDCTSTLYDYFQALLDAQQRLLDIEQRKRDQETLEPLLVKKADIKARQKKGISAEEEQWLLDNAKLRKLVDLQPKETPVEPVLSRTKQIKLTLEQIMEQAHYIGCYTGIHPASLIPGSKTYLESCIDGDKAQFSGIVASVKEIVTRAKKEKMAFFEFDDGTESVEVIAFPKLWEKQQVRPGDLIYLSGEIEIKEDERLNDDDDDEALYEPKKIVKATQIEIYRRAQLE